MSTKFCRGHEKSFLSMTHVKNVSRGGDVFGFRSLGEGGGSVGLAKTFYSRLRRGPGPTAT